MFKVLSAVIVVAAIGGGGWWLWRNRERIELPRSVAAEPEVAVMRVAARPASDPVSVLTVTGKIVSDHRVAVVTKVSGQIVELNFEQGDAVQKGQVLARIEDVNYRARRDQASAMLQKSEANLEYQRFNFTRIERLFADKVSTDIEFADARRWLSEAEAQVAADRASLEFASKALKDCDVIAPISGVVLERNVEVGDFVAAEGGRGANANAQFALIADMTKLRVEVDISELDIGRIRDDMPCVITPDAYKDRKYGGRVMWIDPGANYAKATVQVKVRIDQPDRLLRVEGSAQVVFQTGEGGPGSSSASGAATVWIPASACLMDASGSGGRVFVVIDNKLTEREVRIGRRNGSQVEVIGGLSDGELIATTDVEKLKAGRRVKS